MSAASLFNPSPTVAAEIIADLTDPAASLTEIAARHRTTLENLTLFLTRPNIAERLENLHLLCTSRVRLIATNLFPRALASLDRVMDASRAQLEADAAAPPDAQRTPEQRHRTLETIRRAASRIISAANFNAIPLFARPTPRPPRAAPNPTPPEHANNTSPKPAAARSAPPIPQAPQPPTNTSSSPKPTPAFHTPPKPRFPLPSRPAHPFKPTATPAALLATAGAATALLDPPSEHWP
jgi:hypothetical protein